ncbi:hypothetical protein [Nonomuraea harbinensis]|uniref:WXG100 family type VII secretion target n=1 Tax=Nonomuraea harbinensis TaxID=1286938 RepID=A0ABW1BM84_9ACTN|nr:hypothetical protein [Nonomuraea harbinensis]
MTSYDEVKARLDSDMQSLEMLARAGEELKVFFNEDDWDESVIGVIHNYPYGLQEWRDRLSLVYAQVTKRESEELQPAAVSPLEKLEDVLRRIAAGQEEVAKRMAATQEEVSKHLGSAHEEIAKNLAVVHEQTTRFMSTQETAIQETAQGFRELAVHIQDAVSSVKSEEYGSPAPVQPPDQPDASPTDDPPEKGFWKS